MSEGILQEFLVIFFFPTLTSTLLRSPRRTLWFGMSLKKGNNVCCPCVWLSAAPAGWHLFLRTTQGHGGISWTPSQEQRVLEIGGSQPTWSTPLHPWKGLDVCLLDRLAFPQVKGPFLCVSTNLLSDPAVWPLTWKWGSALSARGWVRRGWANTQTTWGKKNRSLNPNCFRVL